MKSRELLRVSIQTDLPGSRDAYLLDHTSIGSVYTLYLLVARNIKTARPEDQDRTGTTNRPLFACLFSIPLSISRQTG